MKISTGKAAKRGRLAARASIVARIHGFEDWPPERD